MNKTLLATVLATATLASPMTSAQENNLPEFTQEEKDWIKLHYQFRDCVSDNVGYGEDRRDIFNDPAAMESIRAFCVAASGIPRQELVDSYEALEQRYPDEQQYLDMLGNLTREDGYFDYETPMMPK